MMPGRDRLSGRAAQPPVPNVTTSSDRRPSADSRPSSAARSATSALGHRSRAPGTSRRAAQAALAADVQQAAFRAQGQRAAGLAIALQAQHVLPTGLTGASAVAASRQRSSANGPAGRRPSGSVCPSSSVPCGASVFQGEPSADSARRRRAATAPTAWRRSSRGSAAAGLAARDGAVPFPACANAIAIAGGAARAGRTQRDPGAAVPDGAAGVGQADDAACGAASSSQRAGSADSAASSAATEQARARRRPRRDGRGRIIRMPARRRARA